ncbi:hypothetical protein L208DRAFT_268042 [Tricholoma matsutake]|nr:hypothetical protein L208DRAFT_268042 [Tricholoma matsutake 945]
MWAQYTDSLPVMILPSARSPFYYMAPAMIITGGNCLIHVGPVNRIIAPTATIAASNC